MAKLTTIRQALSSRHVWSVAALCVATLAVMATPWRYKPAEPASDLASSTWIERAVVRNGAEAGGGLVRIRAGGGPVGQYAAYLLPPLPTADAIRAQVEVRAVAIEHGPRSWQYAEVALWAFDASGRSLWYWPKRVATVSGSHDWTWFAADVPLAGEIDRMVLIVRNASSNGELSVRGLKLHPLHAWPAMEAARLALIAGWVLAIGWIGLTVVRRRGVAIGKLILLGVAAMALAGILTPQPLFAGIIAPIEGILRDYNPFSQAPEPAPSPLASAPQTAPPREGPAAARDGAALAVESPPSLPSDLAPPSPLSFKQVGHFLCFATLAYAAWMAFPGTPVGALAVYLVLALLASEVLQLFVITRSSTWGDLTIDSLGVIVGLTAAALMRVLVRRARPVRPRAFAESP